MSKLIDLTGQRFGRLTVIERAGSDKHNNARWKCVCDCGNILHISGNDLRNGHTRSCGCLKIDKATTHGGNGSRLYRIWRGMRDRCYNCNMKNFRNYGGRGITVCDEWRYSFEAFRAWALSHGYQDNLSIDRIDNDKGYGPDNCRWATPYEQTHNRRPSCKGKEQ